MRKYIGICFLLFIINFGTAQKFDYNKQWQIIQTKINKDHDLKSSLELLSNFKKQAFKDGNDQEYIRSLQYFNIIQNLTTDGNENRDWETQWMLQSLQEERDAKGMVKNWLVYYNAQSLESYSRINIYKIKEITDIGNYESDSVDTWSREEFKREIFKRYEFLLNNEKSLAHENILDWPALFIDYENVELTPTLFHYFMHSYLNWFESNGGLTDEEKAKSKVKIKEIYDRISSLNIKNNWLDSYAYFQESEIKSANNDWGKTNNSLLQLLKDPYVIKSDYYTDISYNIARVYSKTGLKDSAFKICNNVLKTRKENKWTQNIENLKIQLLQKNASLNLFQLSNPRQKIPVKVIHYQTDGLYLRIYDISSRNGKEFIIQDSLDAQNKLHFNAPLVREQKIPIKKFDDFESHRTLILWDALPAGTYKYFISNQPDFQVKDTLIDFINEDNFMVSQYMLVSNTFNYKETGNAEILDVAFQIFDNDTGLPYSDQLIKLYDNIDGEFLKTLKTDNNGFFTYHYNDRTNKADVYDLAIEIGNENAFFNIGDFVDYHDYFYHYGDDENSVSESINIFTDRSIYRPGQKLFFKALLFQTRNDNNSVLAGKILDVSLMDPNYETIQEMTLTTNEFGSVAGTFDLPDNGVLGQYSINVGTNKRSNDYSFRIEEYKRPKFEVKFEPLKEDYSLQDSVRIKGNAQSFSGSLITNGEVKYVVKRERIFPFPIFKNGRCYPPPYRYDNPEIIKTGSLNTDSDGKFEIVFFPERPADKEDKKYPETFKFTIEADVTDINGETQSGNTQVSVGDIPKKLEIKAPSKITAKDFKEIKINSTNLNNERNSAKGSFEIITLKDPYHEVITRFWNVNSDYSTISENVLEEDLPHWSFSDKVNYKGYTLGETIYKEQFFNPEFQKENENWGKYSIPELKKGYYLIQASEIYGRDTIRAFQYVEILDDETRTSNNHCFLEVNLRGDSFKVGDEVTIDLYTDIAELEVFYFFEYKDSNNDLRNIRLKKGMNHIRLKIEASMKSGLYLNYYATKWQKTSHETIEIPILKENTNLNITTKVFRDKIRPGEDEKWQIQISGPDKEKVSAELLATMYDASLDEIAYHQLRYELPYHHYYSKSLNEYWAFPYNNKIYSRALFYQFSRFLEVSSGLSTLLPINGFTFNLGMNRKLNGVVSALYVNRVDGLASEDKMYDGITVTGLNGKPGEGAELRLRGIPSSSKRKGYIVNGEYAESINDLDPSEIDDMVVLNDSASASLYGNRGIDEVIIISTTNGKINKPDFGDVPIRRNLQETAFFFPQLRTNENGDVILEFTSPEALTKWKLQLLAHTKDMKTGSETLFTQTQKELMVIPNPPRFLREGDEISFSTKIANMSQENLSGDCTLQIFNAANMNPVDDLFGNSDNAQSFTVDKGGNTSATWKLKIPEDIPAIVYRVIAKTATFSDGEENSLPILTNRQLITETIPIFVREGQNKTYEFEKLKENTSTTLDSHLLKLELNTNPTWMAIFALPYLMDFPYECSEQLFNRYYANSIAQEVMAQNPDFQRVMDVYADNDVSTSKLLQNQEVKNIAIENSPWLKDALSQEEQMKMLAEHFQKGKMEKELKKTSQKFWDRQMQSGGFAWFEGGRESKYISEYILAGLGKLKKMNADNNDEDYQNNIYRLIEYCDNEMMGEILEAQKAKKPYIPYAFNYLYARSFWADEVPIERELNAYIEKLIKSSESDYAFTNLQEQAQYALILQRFGKTEEAKKRLHFIEETSVDSEKNGMYWKANTNGFGWYEKPVETQAAIIEAFQEISPEKVEDIESMKVWLIGQKQNQHWSTSKSTSEAIYAFLNSGKSWSNSEEGINIQSQFVIPDNDLTKTGSIESSIEAKAITQNSSHLEISKTSPGAAMGGMYWQYFENLENITASSSGLVIKKELFLKVNTEKGAKLQTIDESYPIKVGDKVTTRLTISSSKDVEFIHLKDMRASGFEPGNILSQYYNENGLSYYLNSRDASTDFFFDYIKKGTYILEYEVIANNSGTFSNGIATLQSMYAPELTAHSEGSSIIIQD